MYALARFLQLPDAICNAIPSTDTYSLQQGRMSFILRCRTKMDIALWAYNHQIPAEEVAQTLNISVEQAQFVLKILPASVKLQRICICLHSWWNRWI